jgi:hypothetical protein
MPGDGLDYVRQGRVKKHPPIPSAFLTGGKPLG